MVYKMQNAFFAQFGQNDLLSTILSFAFIFVLIFFAPRLMTTQTIWKLEKDVEELEQMTERARKLTIKRFIKKPTKELHDKIKNFMEFFIAEPVSVDPFGIVKKLDHVLRNADIRQKSFVDTIAPTLSKTEKADLRASLIHTSGIYQIAKIIRHFLETIKKYKIFQLALLLQMQLPLIKRVAKALYESVDAFTKALPVGDGIGAMVAASFIPANAKPKVMQDEEFVYYKTIVSGRRVIVSKADGPGTAIGHPGKFVQNIMKKEKITRIITVDAASGLEGERSGSIAEGVGFGMRGGNPVDSFEIEEISVKNKLYLDDIAIKEVGEEALMSMKRQILDSLPKAIEATKQAIARSRKNDKILLIGLGNTCGIGNNKKAVDAAVEKLRKVHKKQKPQKKPWWKF